MVTFSPYPIPVTTPLGDGYLLYVKSNNMFENDEFAIVLCNGGDIKHFNSSQVKIWHNATYDIKKQQNNNK